LFIAGAEQKLLRLRHLLADAPHDEQRLADFFDVRPLTFCSEPDAALRRLTG
jgi:hypothetical protein